MYIKYKCALINTRNATQYIHPLLMDIARRVYTAHSNQFSLDFSESQKYFQSRVG